MQIEINPHITVAKEYGRFLYRHGLKVYRVYTSLESVELGSTVDGKNVGTLSEGGFLDHDWMTLEEYREKAKKPNLILIGSEKRLRNRGNPK